jgi:hypothetical protein
MHVAFRSGIRKDPPQSLSRHQIMADKKKPTVKELPTKAVPTRDANKVKGGRVKLDWFEVVARAGSRGASRSLRWAASPGIPTSVDGSRGS